MRRVMIMITIIAISITTASAEDGDTADTADVSLEVVVTSSRPLTVASDHVFRADDLRLLPRQSTQDLLRVVPGMMIAQHAGGGKAEQIFLRGFDADHGTDVSISVDGAPVNMVSHGHGQGYADLHFVIPEVIDRIDVVKGPYLAEYGDLTTAGAVSLHTADSLPGTLLKVEGGSFGYYRGVALLAGTVGTTNLYGGGEVTRFDGFVESPQDLTRTNLIAKSHTTFDGGRYTLTSALSHFTSAWDASGQIPVRAVQSGEITRFGSIDPNEGGNTQRTSAVVDFSTNGPDEFSVSASAINYRFQLFSNFTFFARDPVRGDMIEQVDDRMVYVLNAKKAFTNVVMNTAVGDVALGTTLGAGARYDNIYTGLFYDSVRTRVETSHDVRIGQSNLNAFVQQGIHVDRLSLILGLRTDYFAFSVDGAATSDLLLSPKATVTFDVAQDFTLFANTGMGFHSNDARVAVVVPRGSTIPRAYGAELGTRWSANLFAVSGAVWLLDLDQEFVWVGDEGTTEEAGRSRRIGIDIEARIRPAPYLTLGGNATLSRGRLRDEQVGENLIPLAPNLTVMAFATVILDRVRSSLRLRHIGSRPANESNTVVAEGFTVVDLTASYAVSRLFEIQLQCENLLNSTWREAQFDTQSRLRSEPVPVSEIHFTPGTPFALRVGIAATL